VTVSVNWVARSVPEACELFSAAALPCHHGIPNRGFPVQGIADEAIRYGGYLPYSDTGAPEAECFLLRCGRVIAAVGVLSGPGRRSTGSGRGRPAAAKRAEGMTVHGLPQGPRPGRPQPPEPRESARWRAFLRRPVVWIGSLAPTLTLTVLNAIGGTAGDRIGKWIGKLPGEDEQPLRVDIYVDGYVPEAYALPRALLSGPDRAALRKRPMTTKIHGSRPQYGAPPCEPCRRRWC